MANKLQLFIYRFSAAAPLAIVFVLIWYLEKKTILLPVICLGISLIIIGIFFDSFIYGKRNLSPISVNIINIKPNDHWVFGYVITYLFPLASTVLTDFDYRISIIIVAILIVVIPLVNSISPNPLLFIVGYHFYLIETENGVTYLLMSKRKLCNKNQVKLVNRLFDYLLIDDWRESNV